MIILHIIANLDITYITTTKKEEGKGEEGEGRQGRRTRQGGKREDGGDGTRERNKERLSDGRPAPFS